MRLGLLFGVLLALLTGCEGGQTALHVEFVIQGEGASSAKVLEIVLRCLEDEEVPLPWKHDLTKLGGGVSPSLVIEPSSSEPCTIELAAQLLAPESLESQWALASAREQMSFAEGQVVRVPIILDTAACTDVDGDQTVAGLGGEHECAGARDCDDLDAATHQGANEICNGVDDDCSGQPDDNLRERMIEVCTNWDPRRGLCSFVEPVCDGEEIICPSIPLRDECEPPFDMNCDGRISCGCEIEIPCPPCHTRRCEANEVFCDPNGPPGAFEGEACIPNEGACLGAWLCNEEMDRFECMADAGMGLEVCNGEGAGVDEDCDGAIDWEDRGCEAIQEVARSCGSLHLSRWNGADGSAGPGDCEWTAAYDLEGCNGDMSSDIPSDILVVLELPAGVILDFQRVNCCGCQAFILDDFSPERRLALIAIDVLGMRDALFVETPGALVVTVDAYNDQDPAVAVGLEISVPIETPADPTGDPFEELGNCVANCTRLDILDLLGSLLAVSEEG